MNAKVYITKEFTFEACHKLRGYDGDCANLHGHSYKLEVTVCGHLNTLSNQGDFNIASNCMVMDFKDLKRLVHKHVIKSHDHSFLNDLYTNPTAEMMVVAIFHLLEKHLPKDVTMHSIKLWETSTSYAEYKG